MKQKSANYDIHHSELESQGKFNEFTIPFNTENTIIVDENYDFEQKGNIKNWISKIFRGIIIFLSPLLHLIMFNFRLKGKKNLKAIKKTGAISVSNHILFLDNLMIRQAFRLYKRLFVTVAPHNCKSGIKGTFLRAGGIIPIPVDHPNAMKMFSAKISLEISKKNVVHFYPEQALWRGYTKPRPFMKGAFTYAAKGKVPVIPMFFTFKQPGKLRKLLGFQYNVTLNILPAVFPKEEFNRGENTRYMLELAQKEVFDCYRQTYNDQRENIYDCDPDIVKDAFNI